MVSASTRTALKALGLGASCAALVILASHRLRAEGQAGNAAMSVTQQNALVQHYCVTCHNDPQMTGGLSLQHFDAAHPNPTVAAMMVGKLKAGAMPPPGMPRPGAGTLYAFVTALSSEAVQAPAAAPASTPPPAIPHLPKGMQPRVIDFPHKGDDMTVQAQNQMVHTICTQCHIDAIKPGGVSFQHFDMAKAPGSGKLAEDMIAKLRAGMMPPAAAPKRPDPASIHAFVVSLEHRIDRLAARHPDPGHRTFQRLNRAEYAQAVHDLLDLNVDVSTYLPADISSAGFNDVADVQTMSPTLMQGYLAAADHISRLAVGDPAATPVTASYTVPEDESQLHHLQGTPFGTRGGISLVHTFPADGTYVFEATLHGTSTDELFGNATIYLTHHDAPLVISVDGTQVAELLVNPYMDGGDEHGHGLRLKTPPIAVTAGPHRISAAFVRASNGPVDDLMAPIEHSLADSRIGTGYGITALPHLQVLTVVGPEKVTGVSETPSRRRIFICEPSAPREQPACAERIISRLATQAFRKPVSARHLRILMGLYNRGRKTGSFEQGIQLALTGILADPRFLFRFEAVPASLRPGQPYRIGDLGLASRLSYFLWDTGPDAELRHLAEQGRLHDRAELDAQVRRMLRDPRAMALSTQFAAQWLRLQDIDTLRPAPLLYPNWDRLLSEDFKRETELFFNRIVHRDRSVLDLLTGDYTYVNQRLADFYGIPDVAGPQFRRVSLVGTHRRGILGQGSFLLQTSVANRTDPVLRGKWVLEVLLGQPPPPPPPGVNTNLSTSSPAVQHGETLSVRQRMALHRANPMCASCHSVIDPIGLALENFDATGHYRMKDNGVPVDASTVLYDGTRMVGLTGLEQAMLKHQDTFLRVFTENLMTYALGRRVEYFDMPTVRGIVRQAARHGYRFSSFVLGIVNSDAFRMSEAATLSADKSRPARKGD